MRKFILLSVLMCLFVNGYCTVWTITAETSPLKFNPDTLIITSGDSVEFALASIHSVQEVNQATWNANGNTALPGGFSTGMGGGMILPAQLTIGTHWYVCTPHASLGMKGVIQVKSATAVRDQKAITSVSIYPNPTDGILQVILHKADNSKDYAIEIFSIHGQRVYHGSVSDRTTTVNLSEQRKGVYFARISTENGILTKKIQLE